MLKEILIKNFFFIEKANLSFSSGLVCITGETGSGKSLLIRAIGALMGDFLSKDALGDKEKECVITGVFSLEKFCQKWIHDKGLFLENNHLIIRRVISLSGNSSFFVNDQIVTSTLIQDLSQLLLERHRQHANQDLLKPHSYINFLDNYANLSSDVKGFSESYKAFLAQKKNYEEWIKTSQEAESNKEYWQSLIQEIEEINPQLEEDEEIRKKLRESEEMRKLDESFQKLQQGFVEDSGGVLSILSRLLSVVNQMKDTNTDLGNLAKRFEGAYYEIEDIADSYKSYYRNLDYSSQEQEHYQSRLFVLNRLKKKLKFATIKEVIDYKEKLYQQIENLQFIETEKEQRREDLDNQLKTLFLKARSISEKRHSKASILEKEINEILEELEMSGVTFSLSIESRKVLGEKGLDKVSFYLLQANRKKPLADVASGGELSRIMLALKSITVHNSKGKSLIFDEVDVGLGGKVGFSLGKYLYKISLQTQAFVITHLATVAAFADTHLRLKKELSSEDFVVSNIDSLTNQDMKMSEIARMLSGDLGESGILHAKDILSRCYQLKKEVKSVSSH